MNTHRNDQVKLRRGVTYHLDTVYDLLNLIPHSAYEQGDSWSGKWVLSEIGDEIKMLYTVNITTKVTSSAPL